MKFKKYSLTHLVIIAFLNLILLSFSNASAVFGNQLELQFWPVKGEVILGFGKNASGNPNFHRGIDISAEPGTKVVSPAKGRIFFAGFTPAGGGSVSIITASGYKITLLQLADISVRKDDEIEPGQELGTVALSGDKSTSHPHVHLGLIDPYGNYVDPLFFLPPQAEMENTDRKDFSQEETLPFNQLSPNAEQEISPAHTLGSRLHLQSTSSLVKESSPKTALSAKLQAFQQLSSQKILESKQPQHAKVSKLNMKAPCLMPAYNAKKRTLKTAEEKMLTDRTIPTRKTVSLSLKPNLNRVADIRFISEGSIKKSKHSSITAKNSQSQTKLIYWVVVLVAAHTTPTFVLKLLKLKTSTLARKFCFSH